MTGIWVSGWAFVVVFTIGMSLSTMFCVAGYKAARRARLEQMREDLWTAHVPRFVREAGPR